MPDPLAASAYRDLVARALAEDIGPGDLTTGAIVPQAVRATGTVIARQTCVVAGLDVAREAFVQVNPAVQWTARKADGDLCAPDDVLADVAGPAASLLAAERTALNFLQQLSGIATLTRRYVDAAGGRLDVLDTRKTTPGLRGLEKYAVRCGGGVNHRTALYDGILIKDNHIRIAGSIAEAVGRVRARGATLPIEVEAQSLREVDDALAAGAEIIMLDNLSDEEMRLAVAAIDGAARIEISGRVTLDRMPALSALGADCVSVGALTHSAPAADISLEMDPPEAHVRSGTN
jgi:nicotinate-nucleotide pyrophosphorylase (carboxylating)